MRKMGNLFFNAEPAPRAKRVFKGEQACIEAFKRFVTLKGGDRDSVRTNVRDLGIINPDTRKQLEIDMYYPPWRLGVEYNGSQHFIFPNKFHRHTPEGKILFLKQRQRDEFKLSEARRLGISLLIVPHTVDQLDVLFEEKVLTILDYIVENSAT